jgi:hypothetical protein
MSDHPAELVSRILAFDRSAQTENGPSRRAPVRSASRRLALDRLVLRRVTSSKAPGLGSKPSCAPAAHCLWRPISS